MNGTRRELSDDLGAFLVSLLHVRSDGAVARALLGASWLAAAAFPSAAQQAPTPLPLDRQGAVQEEVVVERIVIDAHIIGPDGNPIPGLTRDDLRVKIDGRPVILEDVEWLPGEKPENDVSALVGPSAKRSSIGSLGAPGRSIGGAGRPVGTTVTPV